MNKNSRVPELHSFFARTGTITVSLVLALLLSACGGAALPPSGSALTQVATDVAATLTAQPTATATATPTLTPTPTITTTPATIPTAGIPITGGLTSAASGCNNATFVKDVSIPDGTALASGQGFTKTWRLRNTGTCDWTRNYSLVFVGGDSMGGSSTQIGQRIVVGRNAEVSVRLTAPNVNGTYTGFWRMTDSAGNTFGDTVFVTIVVEQRAVVTVVVTATPVPATATPTPH